jgi:hypothetical protein
MTFFEKSKQANQSKTEGGSTLLVWHYKTRPRHVSESRHSMNLRNVKLFRAVMHDQLEMTIYVNDDLVWIRNLQLRAGNCCGLLIKDVLPQ